MTEPSDQEKWRMERELIHQNARKQRQQYCEWCGHAVGGEDHSKKFHQAGGVLAGPFCSHRCWADYLRTHEFHDVSRAERREYYRTEDAQA